MPSEVTSGFLGQPEQVLWCVYLCVFQYQMTLLLFDDRMARVILVAKLCVWASERVLTPPRQSKCHGVGWMVLL